MSALTAQELAEVRRLYEQGVPKTTIADTFGVHRNTVSKWLKTMGVKRPAKKVRQAS